MLLVKFNIFFFLRFDGWTFHALLGDFLRSNKRQVKGKEKKKKLTRCRHWNADNYKRSRWNTSSPVMRLPTLVRPLRPTTSSYERQPFVQVSQRPTLPAVARLAFVGKCLSFISQQRDSSQLTSKHLQAPFFRTAAITGE